MVRPGAAALGQGHNATPDLTSSTCQAPGGFDGFYPCTHVLPLGYPGDRMLIADDEPQWINPNKPLTWGCAHETIKDRGHTTLYVIHSMTSDEVLYVGITNDVKRRFKQHRGKQPWWPNSETASLECYTSWDDAAEAERSRIESWQPLYNIAGNAGRATNCTTCEVCGFPIKYGEIDWDEEVPTQHDQCNGAIWDAYMMGMAAMLPDDDPWAIETRARYGTKARP